MGLHYKDQASPINISDKVSFRQSDQDQHRKCPPIVTICSRNPMPALPNDIIAAAIYFAAQQCFHAGQYVIRVA